MKKSLLLHSVSDKTSQVLHPFLFAAYPVLFLFAKNPDEVLLSDVIRAFSILVVLLVLGLLGLQLVLKNRVNAGVLLTALIIMFFGYSSVRALLVNVQIGSLEIGRHRYLLPAWAITAVVLSVAVRFVRRDLRPLSRYLNIVGVILVLMCLGDLGLSRLRAVPSREMATQWAQALSAEKMPTNKFRWTGNGKMPDIYYIVLDQYVREDVLKQDFGYDNSDFIKYLTDKGFYVAGASRANYPRTHWSLPSSLNYDTMDALSTACGVEVMNYPLLQKSIKESRIRHVLEGLGYRFVQPTSTFALTEQGSDSGGGFLERALQSSEFNRVLMETTVLGPLKPLDSGVRKRHISTFEYLGQVPNMSEPTFGFFHICCPHPPYVFERDGSSPDILAGLASPSISKLKSCYIEQLEYVNVLTRRAIDKILATSNPQPIIIIQADHGYLPHDFFDPKWDPNSEKARKAMHMRTAILNAYYFPEAEKELYDTITPVNSFRVLLNTYFGGNLQLLKDTVHFPKSPFAEWNYSFCRNDMMECRLDTKETKSAQ